MKNKLAFLLALCLLLCSCDKGKQGSTTTTEAIPPVTTTTAQATTTTTTSETTIAPVTTTVTTTEEKELLGYFLDYEGEKVYYKDATALGDGEITPEDAERAEMVYCEYDGFTYSVFSKGFYLDSAEHEFDFEEKKFKNLPVFMEAYQLTRINVGDTFGPLTVSEASCTLMVANSEEIAQYVPFGIELSKADLKFSGEITLKGYICTATDFAKLTSPGDISFRPEKAEWENMPVIVYPDGYKVHGSSLFYSDNNQVYSDAPFFRLGSINTDYDGIDTSAIPKDGTSARVEITITDIHMYENASEWDFTEGKIVSVKEI